MEQEYVTGYMKEKTKAGLFKAVVSILTGYMFVLFAIFTVVTFNFFLIALLLAVLSVIFFIAGIYAVRKTIWSN